MRAKLHHYLASVLLALGLLQAPAFAGQQCLPEPPTLSSVQNGLAAGRELQAALTREQPQVALVARVGQDLSEYGLRYSHVAFVWRAPGQSDWSVVHLLNGCGSAESALWREGLGNFFMDTPFSYESLLMLPPAEVQQRLYALLQDQAGLQALHQSHYNMLAYPFSTTYQNSNQWVLEVLARALNPALPPERAAVQSWLERVEYQPTTLSLRSWTRLGARITRVNVAFDDHPTGRRLLGRIDTVTVDSMRDFLLKQQPGSRLVEVKPQLP